MRISDWSSDVCSSDLRARRVVGHAVDDDRDAARAIALVADFLEVVGPTLAAAALDRALGGVLGHVGIEGLVEHQPQARIGLRIAAAGTRGDGDLPNEIGEQLAALGVFDALASGDTWTAAPRFPF